MTESLPGQGVAALVRDRLPAAIGLRLLRQARFPAETREQSIRLQAQQVSLIGFHGPPKGTIEEFHRRQRELSRTEGHGAAHLSPGRRAGSFRRQGLRGMRLPADTPKPKAKAERTSRQARLSEHMVKFQCSVEKFVSSLRRNASFPGKARLVKC